MNLRLGLLLTALPLAIACGGDDDGNGGNVDASTGSIDAAADIDAPPTAVACDDYCANALTNCTGENVLFGSAAECMASCAAMPEGASTDQAGNTAFCRAYHSGVPAAGDPATHCPHASTASEGGVCGPTCDAYCDQIMTNCTGNDAQYADRNACMTACAEFPVGNYNDTLGDTVECRTYHASFPAAGDPAVHCPHAGMDGGGVCVDD